jgi:cysteinyl-tRNA synthetase
MPIRVEPRKQAVSVVRDGLFYSQEGAKMAIHLYNSMTGRKEQLETIEPGKVKFYACGPTVYNLFHIGNARMFVIFDTVRRYLEYRGYKVDFVQNFTDVDDRIIHRANELGIGVRDVADKYIEEYFTDAAALGIKKAVVHPRVTECIPDIISFIRDLIQKGNAYERDGNVYFDTSSFAGYGKLSHQSADDMRAGFRVEVLENKDDPTDFALWKAAKPDEEYWESPWGKGRPGWHIECSVMNLKYLGEQIDIHAGGRDLVFPHHENEIAQSEAHSGHMFARYWLHNGTLNINGEKMSKSTGNYIMTRDLLAKESPMVIRYFLLSAQYRHPLNYTELALLQSEQALDRIERCVRNLEYRMATLREAPGFLGVNGERVLDEVRGDIEESRTAFITAMDDDFNTADAISAIFEAVRLSNLYLAKTNVTVQDLEAWHNLLTELLRVLGLGVTKKDASLEEEISRLIEKRNEARASRDFKTADAIRDELLNRDIILEDTASGTRWSRR